MKCDNPNHKRHTKMICDICGKPYWKWHWREHWHNDCRNSDKERMQ